jgi:predicted regulator of Ras-like GTPase activity (Roadblock/LC7/MglB family)
MVTHRGATKKIDVDTISALVAGSFAATREMAKLLGRRFSALFHQGKATTSKSRWSATALLTAIFDDQTTVGMVRLYAAEAAKRLAAIFKKKAADAAADRSEKAPVEPDAAFRKSTATALDDLFGGK